VLLRSQPQSAPCESDPDAFNIFRLLTFIQDIRANSMVLICLLSLSLRYVLRYLSISLSLSLFQLRV
jgi:hypothetical protein